MKNYLVIAFEDANDSYYVNDLTSLINEMYEVELMNGESFESVSDKFYSYHKVYEIDGTIKELN